MRRAVVAAVVALPLSGFVACFSDGPQDEAPDGGNIDVNRDSGFTMTGDAAPLDATYADTSVDSGPDSTSDAATDVALDVEAGCDGPCGALPATCADILAAMPAAVDGPFTLYVGHDPAQPWAAYCATFSATPKEYLPLVQTGASSNFSQYTSSAATGGSNVVTSYTKVRIDPTTLVVDTGDQTFATSTGSLSQPPSGPTVMSMPYAEAMDCAGPGSLTGIGNVDLRGTPFSVAPAWFTFPPGGTSTAGTATYSSDNQVVALMGGGNCGWEAPLGYIYPAYNTSGGPILDLVYGLGADAGAPADAGADAADAADAAD